MRRYKITCILRDICEMLFVFYYIAKALLSPSQRLANLLKFDAMDIAVLILLISCVFLFLETEYLKKHLPETEQTEFPRWTKIVRIVIRCSIALFLVVYSMKNMMYFTLFVLSLVLGAIGWAIGKFALHLSPKKLGYLVVAVAVVGCLLLSAIPFENAVVSFESPQAAYAYTAGQDADISQVIYGEETALVCHAWGMDDPTILPRMGEKWGIAKPIHLQEEKLSVNNGAYDVTVYHLRGSEEYYICLRTSNGSLSVTDNRNSSFIQTIHTTSVEHLDYEHTTYKYWAYVSSPDATYQLYVDGKLINSSM